MKDKIKKIVPLKLVKFFRFRRVFYIANDAIYDLKRYLKYSSAINYDNDEEKLRAVITATYHNIEKGLSLPDPRLGFGKANIENLIHHINTYIALYGAKDHLSIPIGAIEAYIELHKSYSHDVLWLEDSVAELKLALQNIISSGIGGTKNLSKLELLAQISQGGLAMLLSRSSCRQYSQEVVSDDLIHNAVRVAQKSPAVCNRQSSRVHVYNNQADISKILDIHGGARGFSQVVTVLFCITVDMRNFNGTGERYQGWIDGGMFAMSLSLGLHAQGLGSCCLNWSKSREDDIKMRELLNLPAPETIIMFIACGHLPNEYVVANSVRKSIHEVLSHASLD